MRKTLNGKSSRCVVSKERNCHRLKAVSDYSFCEVRPGVDWAKDLSESGSAVRGYALSMKSGDWCLHKIIRQNL